jgi:hypothetical protein
MGGIGGGSTPFWVGLAVSLHNPIAAVMGVIGTVALGYVGAHTLFRRSARKREVELRELAEQLAVQARESIAAATRKIGGAR